MPTVAELLVEALADHGVSQVWGVVGDALNPVTDAIHRHDRVAWMGVRHEEAGAFAAGAQAQLSGRLGVCMGTVGPGAIHLLQNSSWTSRGRASRAVTRGHLGCISGPSGTADARKVVQ